MAAPQGQPCSRLELSFECAKLPDKDITSKSDPCCLLYTRRSPVAPWELVGKTETMNNNLNPVFTTPVLMDYFFEEVQYLKIEVLDVDKTDTQGNVKGESLGVLECRLSEIVGARGCTIVRPLKNSTNKSVIKVMAEEATAVKGTVVLSLKGVKLANRDGWFGKSDPFYVLSKAREDGAFAPCTKSNVVKNDLNPTWQPLRIPLQRLCNGDMNRPLRLEVLDFDDDDKFESIGWMMVTTQELLHPGWQGKLKHPKGKDKDVGTVVASAAQLVQEPTFMDYMQGGLELGLMVAVDFTASNGSPDDPRSLHFASRDPAHPNPYESAITAVGAVLAPYDLDGQFPCYGYGGQMPNGVVSHCFALNGNPDAAACAGVDGILAAYRQALSAIALSGPTCFAPVINAACDMAQATLRDPPGSSPKYTILLIITDGAIMDMDASVNAIVRASRLPLSLIIVGVGSADFSSMEALDADKGALRGSAGVAARDCVQFVKMNDYVGLGSGARLARDVLAEAPAQVVQFFMGTGRQPGPPQPKPQSMDPTQF